MLRKLASDTAKMNALRTNIKIRADGFGWDWSRHAWSKDGRKYSISELAKHLRWVITEENNVSKKHPIPTEPGVNLPDRATVGVLGTDIDFVKILNERYLADEGEFKKNADRLRQKRESEVEGGKQSIYYRMQPFERPDIADLLGRRIDVNWEVIVDGRPVLKWCQGEVINVYEDKSKPTVRVLWDPTPDIAGCEEESESDQILMPGNWNKNSKNAWRLDFDIAVGDVDDEEDVVEDEVDDDCAYDEESSDDEEEQQLSDSASESNSNSSDDD